MIYFDPETTDQTAGNGLSHTGSAGSVPTDHVGDPPGHHPVWRKLQQSDQPGASQAGFCQSTDEKRTQP